jgi:hypothetical protein
VTAPLVELWLSVRRSAQAYVTTGDDATWTKAVPMAFLPQEGNEVALWPADDGDPATGPLWPVEAPRWGSDGVAWVELMPMRVDPDDKALQAIQRLGRERPWWTANDGADIEARLTAAGWTLR